MMVVHASVRLSLIALTCLSCALALSIEEFGAIPNDSSDAAAFANARAFEAAFANASAPSSIDRTVVVPAHKKFYQYPWSVYGQSNITLQIDGTIVLQQNVSAWPRIDGSCADAINFTTCDQLVVQGSGTIDGQGFEWWVLTLENKLRKGGRPRMFNLYDSSNVEIKDVTMINSPQFHMRFQRVANVTVHGVTIWVNVEKQKALLRKHGKLTKEGWPTFPLNTDGIDPAGINVHIYNCTIENFDDAVAVKPTHGLQSRFSNCSENMLIEDCTVRFGVGMTIGSVPPNANTNCVRNIVFRNIVSEHPLKAIYVKTNPGTVGDGIIHNITYANFVITYPIWWSIYVGPQQQEQPDGSGPGCMLYPLLPHCETQPRVPITALSLINITSTHGVLSPGILRCNETRPCTDFHFENVHVSGSSWPHDGWICENIQGTVANSSPALCFGNSHREHHEAVATLPLPHALPHGDITPQNTNN